MTYENRIVKQRVITIMAMAGYLKWKEGNKMLLSIESYLYIPMRFILETFNYNPCVWINT